MSVQGQHLVLKLALKSTGHRQHHDQRGHAQHHAHRGDGGEDREQTQQQEQDEHQPAKQHHHDRHGLDGPVVAAGQKERREGAQGHGRGDRDACVETTGPPGVLGAVQVAQPGEALEGPAIEARQTPQHQRHQEGRHHRVLQGGRGQRRHGDHPRQRELQDRPYQPAQAANLSAGDDRRHGEPSKNQVAIKRRV